MDFSEINHVNLMVFLFLTVFCGQGEIAYIKDHDLSKIFSRFWESNVGLISEACS